MRETHRDVRPSTSFRIFRPAVYESDDYELPLGKTGQTQRPTDRSGEDIARSAFVDRKWRECLAKSKYPKR